MVTAYIETLYSPFNKWILKQFFFNSTVFLTFTLTALWLVHLSRIRGNQKLQILSLSTKKFPTHLHFPWMTLPILEGLYTLCCIRRDGVEAMSKLASKYKESPGFELYVGPIKAIMVTDARVCHKILSSTDPNHLSKPQAIYSKIFIEWIKKGMVPSNYDRWVNQRKVLSRAFTYRALQSYTGTMNKQGKKLVQDWLEFETPHGKGQVIQGKELHDSITFKLIGSMLEVILGTGQCTEEDSSTFGHYFLAMKEIVVYRFLHAELFIPPIWWLHPKKWKLDRLIKESHGFIAEIIRKYERKMELEGTLKTSGEVEAELNKDLSDNETGEKSKGMKCLIEHMLSFGANAEEVYYEIGTFLVAGHETTETAMKMILFDLALNPIAQQICREEVDLLFNFQPSVSDFKLQIGMDELSNLKYVEKCILESLRMNPVAPFYLRTIDSPLKITEDFAIDAGSIAIVSPWLIQKNERYFKDPETYNPNRFDPEEVKQRELGTFIPFSAGPRNCVGWKFAIMEMKIMLTWILRFYTLSTEDKREDVKILFDATIKPEKEYRVRLKLR